MFAELHGSRCVCALARCVCVCIALYAKRFTSEIILTKLLFVLVLRFHFGVAMCSRIVLLLAPVPCSFSTHGLSA